MRLDRRIVLAAVLAVAGFLCASIAPTQAQAPLRAGPLAQAAVPQPAPGEGVELTVSALDAVTGDPLTGVQIGLHRLRTVADPREWSYASTTDMTGRSVISNVVAERYSISATLTGRIPVAASEQILTLAPSARPRPVILRMYKSGTISGVVEDADHNPLARATVELLEERWIAGQRTLARIRTAEPTGSAGGFSFENLLSGSYYLRARPDPSAISQQLMASRNAADPDSRVAFVNTMYPGAQFFEDASPIVLTQESIRQDVRIQVQKVRRYAVRGKVGNLAPGISTPGLLFIRLVSFEAGFPFILGEPYDERIPTQIAADGTFSYEPGLPPGHYWAGYTPGGGANRYGGIDFRVVDQDVELKTDLWEAFPVAGTIVYEDGTPAANLSGSVRNFSARRTVRSDAFGTDGQGAFSRSLHSDGIFRIDLGDSGVTVRKIEQDSRTWLGPEFEVSRRDGPIVVTVSRKGASISGSVTLHKSTQGYPRGVVTLAVDPANPLDIPLRKRLNAPNNFSFENLEAGRYRLCAWVEEGTEISHFLGNPAYDRPLASLCQIAEVKAGGAGAVDLKQFSVADIQ